MISSVDMKTYTTSYYVVKLDAKSEKSAKWEDYKDKLKEIILAQKQRDSSFVATVLKEALQKANVKVKDSAFQNLLSQYVTTEESSSSSTKSSSSSTESSSSTTESSSSSGQ